MQFYLLYQLRGIKHFPLLSVAMHLLPDVSAGEGAWPGLKPYDEPNSNGLQFVHGTAPCATARAGVRALGEPSPCNLRFSAGRCPKRFCVSFD